MADTVPTAGARITSLGNAGFLVETKAAVIALDPFDWSLPQLALPVQRLDLVLVTHDHWDHFDRLRIGELAASGSAVVCGPRSVVHSLRTELAPELLHEVDPASASGNPRRAVPTVTTIRGMTVGAYRSTHSRDHTSYLVRAPEVSLFHDGDNQDTTLYDPASLHGLDCLMLCPWQDSGWVPFIQAVRPRHWFLMHLDSDELDRHAKGGFLPRLCETVPMEPVALRPGQSVAI